MTPTEGDCSAVNLDLLVQRIIGQLELDEQAAALERATKPVLRLFFNPRVVPSRLSEAIEFSMSLVPQAG